MPSGLGLRFTVEAVVILAVAVASGLAGLSTIAIIALVAAAWALMSGIEWAASHRPAEDGRGVAPPSMLPPLPAGAGHSTSVRVLPPTPAPEAPPPSGAAPEPPPAAPERPVLTSMPAPPPPPPEPAPAAPSVVSLASRDTRPREWNLWELERVVRAATLSPQREDELNYLLMYLREFANADGSLSVDFDSLVRDSFADLLAAAPR